MNDGFGGAELRTAIGHGQELQLQAAFVFVVEPTAKRESPPQAYIVVDGVRAKHRQASRRPQHAGRRRGGALGTAGDEGGHAHRLNPRREGLVGHPNSARASRGNCIHDRARRLVTYLGVSLVLKSD